MSQEWAKELCARCGCCEMVTEECEQCDEGLDGHDCGEDCCCCEDPEPNLPCQFCSGRGYFMVCLGRCDEHGQHAAKAVASEGKAR